MDPLLQLRDFQHTGQHPIAKNTLKFTTRTIIEAHKSRFKKQKVQAKYLLPAGF